MSTVKVEMMVEQYYTVAEIAGMLKKHPQTIRADIRAGNLEVETLGGRNSQRVAASELNRYVNWLKTHNSAKS